jgi:hypothetical protein
LGIVCEIYLAAHQFGLPGAVVAHHFDMKAWNGGCSLPVVAVGLEADPIAFGVRDEPVRSAADWRVSHLEPCLSRNDADHRQVSDESVIRLASLEDDGRRIRRFN